MIDGITAVNWSFIFQIRGRFSTDFAPRSRKSSPRHREIGRLPRAISGAKVRAVLQLQHCRYGNERHDAEQQGHQHQSLRYVVLERIYIYIYTASIHLIMTTYTHIRLRRHIYTSICMHFTYTHSNVMCQWPCTYIRSGNKAFALTTINTPSPSVLTPPLLYHPQRYTRMVQLTRRTIMRYRNSARYLCSIRMLASAAGQPSPTSLAIRTASSPRTHELQRPRTKRW